MCRPHNRNACISCVGWRHHSTWRAASAQQTPLGLRRALASSATLLSKSVHDGAVGAAKAEGTTVDGDRAPLVGCGVALKRGGADFGLDDHGAKVDDESAAVGRVAGREGAVAEDDLDVAAADRHRWGR